ncbi:F-box domain, cyclin-like protein [Artemisia annua]|uniref:F-box domain, cyclin-like protein n=1 Tax=Artemisia annua TaxID=35608 RepID=A0A2U1PY05_ARTAN|nr:F-box domain, cyclin-like protein [Artemisia annua]
MLAQKNRISNLPDDVIHHILSFLDIKYVVQTSALSRKWRNLWTTTLHINLNSDLFLNLPKFAEFVKHALSDPENHKQLSAVDLIYTGAVTESIIEFIVNYAYTRNIQRLSVMLLNPKSLQIPEYFFSSESLKHLTLSANNIYSYCCIQNSDWDFPSLETLSLTNIQFGTDSEKSVNLFSKCVSLTELTLHQMHMNGLKIFSICAPKLTNLTITEPDSFPEVLNVVSPQLKNLTASVRASLNDLPCYDFLQFSTEGFSSLEKVYLSLSLIHEYEEERHVPVLQNLFQKLHTTKVLILDLNIVEILSSFMEEFSDEPCPFHNLQCLKIDTERPKRDRTEIATMATQVRKYLLQNSPSATFIMDLPQVPDKRSRDRVDSSRLVLLEPKYMISIAKMSNSRPKRRTKRSTKYDDFVSDSVAGKTNKNSSNNGEASNGGNVSDNGEFQKMMGCENKGKGDKKCCSEYDAEKELDVSNDETHNGMSAEDTTSDAIGIPSESRGSPIGVADKVTGCKSPNASSSMLNNIDNTNSGNLDAASPNSSITARYADKLNNNMNAENQSSNVRVSESMTVNNTGGKDDSVRSKMALPKVMLMCNRGMRRLGYARVLVEINAEKGLVDSIDILYKNTVTEKQFVKTVKVEYDWKPPICSTCRVFGHSIDSHKKASSESNGQEVRKENEEFIGVERKKDQAKEGFVKAQQNKKGQNLERRNMEPEVESNKWKFCQKDIEEVENYAKLKMPPSFNVTGKWSQAKNGYFKECWERLHSKNKKHVPIKENIELDENDVYIDKSGDKSGTAEFMASNEVHGVGTSDLSKTDYGS